MIHGTVLLCLSYISMYVQWGMYLRLTRLAQAVKKQGDQVIQGCWN